MGATAAVAIALAATLDAIVGEVPTRVHPVALLGGLVGRLDREWSRPVLSGALIALWLPILAAGVCGLSVALAQRLSPWAGALLAGCVLFVTTSLRMLIEAARSVVDDSERATERARATVPALVGRDPESLSPPELRSAAVESAAENLSDGLVAPLVAFTLGAVVSLPLAAAAAAWVKSVNTLDSMLGYRSKPVGTASARLDDAVMFVPARLSAVAIALSARRPSALGSARAWARAPPSPNSGWPMATLAAALGVRLHKPGVYDIAPEASLPSVAQGRHAVAVVTGAGVLSILTAGVVSWW